MSYHLIEDELEADGTFADWEREQEISEHIRQYSRAHVRQISIDASPAAASWATSSIEPRDHLQELSPPSTISKPSPRSRRHSMPQGKKLKNQIDAVLPSPVRLAAKQTVDAVVGELLGLRDGVGGAEISRLSPTATRASSQ